MTARVIISVEPSEDVIERVADALRATLTSALTAALNGDQT